jgi:hypothetical protein
MYATWVPDVLWGGFSVRDADFNLPQHRHDLLWFVPLDWHDQLFLQVDSLSFHLVQISPVTSRMKIVSHYRRTAGWVYDQRRF